MLDNFAQITGLTLGSHTSIKTNCDICNREKYMEYRTYYKLTKGLTEKCYCRICSKEKINKTNLEKYGFIYPHQNEEVKRKTVKTNLKKYGVEHSSQLDECKEKQKNTNMERYGIKTSLQNIELREKGMIKKFGKSSPINNKEIKDRINKTNIERYGFDNPLKSRKIREKIRETNLEKYGFENPMSNDKTKNKVNETKRLLFLDKYKDIIIDYDINKKIIIMKCENNHNFEIDYTTFINRKKLNTKMCVECYPIGTYSNSGYEIQLQDFIKSICDKEIVFNSKKIINKEIDIYIPELKLGFEFNGLYWHNELNVSNNYHLNKTEECEKLGIKLIHIYEDDWIYKKEVVKSRILNIFNGSERIFARKCKIEEVSDSGLIRDFLKKNHLQGFIGSKIKIGLFYDEKLVSLMTFGSYRKSMGKKYEENSYEMLRFCNKINTNVVGGASRLFKYFIEKFNPSEIISYADRSWSRGGLYKNLGFEFIHKTVPNYHYVFDGVRKYRFGFRKDKLIKEGFDSSKSEHEIMLERKIYRIYDSGNLLFSFRIL